MEKDFLRSRYIIRTEDGFECSSDTTKINYHFSEREIWRTFNTDHIDTFKVAPYGLSTSFEGNEVLAPDTLDGLHFMVLLNDGVRIQMQFKKVYSAKDLLRQL
ncbi:hypothetical protein EZ449_15355 [Pedobacter frigidisoli]|uniref:Uncharacterized protein n=1 Tax=Pedobacter frigidisoli TaxID=2530455 RepID=A0A4R0NVY6_9SPHI|nr:hypothetical protein [Pedobacter frigidisoli]TCD05840.1 hypothetical protein EZ449_15355 [Pedobacter frigidisoli]